MEGLMKKPVWIIALLIGAACISISASARKHPHPNASTDDGIAELRAGGPAQFEDLLAKYDALYDGTEKTALAAVLDKVGAQKYAHVSRLYWFTDLKAAKAEAKRTGKPILSLRLLGRLDEDLSCVNSRFFRVALYGNAALSKWMKDNYVLHWSSERPAPLVTVDFGDGRKLERTVGGNSIHFILDAKGRPVDAIPGLMGPGAFQRELTAALPLATRAGAYDEKTWKKEVAAYHQERLTAMNQTWQDQGLGRVFGAVVLDDGTVLEAEYVTVSKASIERPMVQRLQLGKQASRVIDDSPMWIQIGARFAEEAKLDAQSKQLIKQMGPTDWSVSARPLDDQALDVVAAKFEQRMAADTALNTYKMGWQLHAWMANEPEPSFAKLDEKVYSKLFMTPAKDPWLGMSTGDAFTALPGDGIVLPVVAKR
jgi:hypothetical protein